MVTPRVLSLFSGIGALDFAAAAVTGGEVVAHVENNASASAVLEARFPEIPNLGDATQVDWAALAPIDVIVSGFSCQDISGAGRRAGITEETRSGITWGATVTAVRALRPRLLLMENVAAILARGLDVVAADLAAAGYDLRWTCLRASDIGAPHRRDRWFAVAYPGREREQRRRGPGVLRGSQAGPDRRGAGVGDGVPAGGSGQDAADCHGRRREAAGRAREGRQPDNATDAESVGRSARWPQSDRRLTAADHQGAAADADGAARSESHERPQRSGQQPPRRGNAERLGSPAADANGAGPQGHGRSVGGAGELAAAESDRPPAADALSGRRTGGPPDARRREVRRAAAARRSGAPASDATDIGRARPGGARHGRQGSEDGRTAAPPDATGAGPQERGDAELSGSLSEPGAVVRSAGRDPVVAWGEFAFAIHRWERLTGVAAPRPTDLEGRLNPDFVEWMMGVPVGWTDVPALPVTRNPRRHKPEQLPHITRAQRLERLGNTVVPAQAVTAFTQLLAEVSAIEEAVSA